MKNNVAEGVKINDSHVSIPGFYLRNFFRTMESKAWIFNFLSKLFVIILLLILIATARESHESKRKFRNTP